MAERVAVVSPDGQFGTVDASEAEAVTRAGGRVLSHAEVKAQETQEVFDKQSTGTKVAAVASLAGPLGYPLHAYLRGKGAVLPPQLEAYTQGVSETFTGGAASVGMKELVEQVGGKQAAHAYGQTAKDASEAHPEVHAAGQAAGLVGSAFAGGPKAGLGGAAKAIPSVAISAAGGVVESSVGRVLAPFAARGVAGRAAVTAAELGARGATEAAIYSGAHEVTDALLGDREVATDKVWSAMGTGAIYGGAGGALLGGTGSLAAAGVRSAMGATRSGVSRALSKGEEVAGTLKEAGGKAEAGIDAAGAEVRGAVRDAEGAVKGAVDRAGVAAENAVNGVADDAGVSLKGIADATGTKAAQEGDAYSRLITRAGSKDAQMGVANEQAWKAIGAGNGLQSTSFAKSAERYLPNGVRDVGEVILRKKIINAEGGIIDAARHGTPGAMLPKIAAELDIVGKKLGDMTAASPAHIDGQAIDAAIQSVTKQYTQSFATKPVGQAVERYGNGLMEHLGVATRGADGQLIVSGKVTLQDLLRERKAVDQMVFEGVALDPSMTVQLKRELRGKLEGLIMDSLDGASGQLPGAAKAEYKALKHDYTALSIAADAAEDSAARMAKGATFGLTDTLRGGGSIIKTIGSKLVRERGNAAAAVLIHRMAEMGTLTKAVAAVDEQIGRAAKGLLSSAPKKPLPEPPPTESIRTRADKVMRTVAEFQANPEAHISRSAQQMDGLRAVAPEMADGISQRYVTTMAFLASKIPVAADVDPFDPHPMPKMSDSQAAEVAAYGYYAERPARFFDELAAGKLTYEGKETAKALMPGAFADLQERTAVALADLMARGQRPPFEQQRRLGALLEFPATPDQRPDHMPFLQENVATAAAPDTMNAAAPAPKRPLKLPSQQSSLDRLTEGGPGRR